MTGRSERAVTPEVIVLVTEPLHEAVLARWRRLIEAAIAVRPARLVVDLSGSPGIDASAIVLLLQVHRQMVRAGGRLVLRGPGSRVRRMLTLAHVAQVFDMETSEDVRSEVLRVR